MSVPSDLVQNLLSEDEHKKQDQLVHNRLERWGKAPTDYLPGLVEVVISTARKRRETTDPDVKNLDAEDVETILLRDNEVSKIVQESAQAGKFENIRNLGAFRKTPNPLPDKTSSKPNISQDDGGAQATLRSWDDPYIGEAHKALFETITERSHDTVRKIYARYLAVVQSSGMGKSRTIDELSKEHFVIPINLRNKGTGFPPGDHDVSNFLTAIPFDPEDALKRAQVFLISLFSTTTAYLDGRLDDCIERIIKDMPVEKHPKTHAQRFRLFMTAGSTFESQGALRRAFYKEVIARANLVRDSISTPDCLTCLTQIMKLPHTTGKVQTAQGSKGNEDESPTENIIFWEDGNELGLEQVVFDLIRILKPNADLTFEDLRLEDPLIILAYDEAHALAFPEPTRQSDSPSPTAFSEHRRVLRMLRDFPVFALFLSTTGKIHDFTPPPKHDSSDRLKIGKLHLLPPFSELGYDQMLKAHELVILEGTYGILDVSKVGFMARFGRPLWGSRYTNGSDAVRRNIVDFALQKLLPVDDHSNIGQNGKLACMSVRLALEFNAQTTEARTREMEQVEKYMRVCILVHEGFETAVTISPSEPLLAEAARQFMSVEPPFNIPSSLLEQLQTMGLGKGDRGELVAEVLLISAADKAIKDHLEGAMKRLHPRSKSEHPIETFPVLTTSRAVSVESFMKALLGGAWHNLLLSSLPAKSRTLTESKRSFQVAFKGFKVYFTHFIKINDAGVINRDFLWRLVARGAAVMCADGQGGVDIIVPTAHGEKLCRSNISAIIVQVKNDKRFTVKPNVILFDLMNPYLIRFFDIGEKGPLPIIRMVFAFGSPLPVVHVIKPDVARPPRKAKSEAEAAARRSPPYTSYDIWCAKASPETFAVVKAEDEPAYAELLKADKVFPKAYHTDIAVPSLENIRRSMNPGTSVNGAHWSASSGENIPEPPAVDLADEIDFGDEDDLSE